MVDKANQTEMPRGMGAAMATTDILFLVYWSVSALVALGLISIPADYLYKDYHNPLMMAWNWSFMPLDVVLSLLGLYAIARFRSGHKDWVHWAIASASLTFCAGLMAIVFWAITLDFDLTWWIPNLFFMLWPMLYVPLLVRANR